MDIFTWIAAISVGVVIGFILGVAHLVARRRKSQKDVHSDSNSRRVPEALLLECDMVPYMDRAKLEDFKTRAKEGLHHGLSSEELNQIIERIDRRVAVIDTCEAAEAEHRAAIELALTDLATLRTINLSDPDEACKVFDQLHQIKIGEGPLTYDDIINYCDVDLEDWLTTTHDRLLFDRFRTLIQSAGEGSTEAYQQVMKLYHDFAGHAVGADGDFVDDYITGHFRTDWNRMIVQFHRYPEWEDGQLIWDDGWGNAFDYRQILREAQGGDLLCLQYVRLMLEDDEHDLIEAMKDVLRAETTEALEAQYEALGFDGLRHPGLPA